MSVEPGDDVLGVEEERADLAAAGAARPSMSGVPGVRVGPGSSPQQRRRWSPLGLVEGDDDEHVAVLVGGGAQDERHPGLEELVGPGEATHVAAGAVGPGAGAVVPVVAEVGRDEAEARRGALAAAGRGPGGPRATACRWRPGCPSGTTLASHSAVLSMTEWNQTKGLCRVVYWSAARRHLGGVGGADGRVARSRCRRSDRRSRRRARACCPCPARRRATPRRGSCGWAGTWRRAARRWSCTEAG